MMRQYGRHPMETDDEKLFHVDGKLNRNVNPDSLKYSPNAITRTVSVINNTAMPLLVLMDDGCRLITQPSMNGSDQKCYFFVEYKLGSDVIFRTDPHLETANVTRDSLERIANDVEFSRVDPVTGMRYRQQSTVRYYYSLDCSSIEKFYDGIYIDALNIHVYVSDNRTDAFKTHYGRSRYACRINDSLDHKLPEGGPQAVGCSAVYYVNSQRNIEPVYSVSKFFTGVLQPIFDPSRPPGVYIHTTQEHYFFNSMRVPGRMFIAEKDFDKGGIFRNVNDMRAYYREAFKKVNSPEALDAFIESKVHMLPGVEWDCPAAAAREKAKAGERKREHKPRDPIATVKEMIILITALLPIVKGVMDGCFPKNKDA